MFSLTLPGHVLKDIPVRNPIWLLRRSPHYAEDMHLGIGNLADCGCSPRHLVTMDQIFTILPISIGGSRISE